VVKYIQGLQACSQTLARNQGVGRVCDEFSAGLPGHQHGKHVVFYRLKPGAIRAVRVLHQRMPLSKSQFAQ
jgi:plasmid stabilization system protein ParE